MDKTTSAGSCKALKCIIITKNNLKVGLKQEMK